MRAHLRDTSAEILHPNNPRCLPRTSAREPRVRISVHEQLHLEQVSDLLRVEHEDALEQNHVGRIQRHKLILPVTVRTQVKSRVSFVYTFTQCTRKGVRDSACGEGRVIEVECVRIPTGFTPHNRLLHKLHLVSHPETFLHPNILRYTGASPIITMVNFPRQP